ncbi:NADPH-dependent FMN reductase [Sabulicella glaciei]|uniref:NAD(P)H-dependent oxidoreductase n=1 Tax=Sabulicella glaciei TaxID=2984948 RepID=A0ABT3NVP5_9PROT|nr:NADPH-dependent FMN reductase [Roseococcus sp. MDT2-1-1]MCW8086207.1 NAD(P)H-dependent oxidoreductase [Roseococcus sp. MDT2-1-1]
MRVLAICGSLRAASLNRKLLRVAAEVAPEGMAVEEAPIGGIPIFDEDIEAKGLPDSVAGLRERCFAADALLFVTPEYNYGVPGGLKNAVDWLSRRVEGKQPFAGKPCAMMGASGGMGGTIRAQLQLRQSLQLLGALTMPGPEVFVTQANGRFDADGNLTDAPTRAAVEKLMAAFGQWIARMKG